MQNSQIPSDRVRSFDLLLFNGFSNHCLANSVEPLRAANDLSGAALYDWRFLTLDGNPVQSSSGLQIAPHGALASGAADQLIVMPSYGFNLLDGRNVTRALRQVAPRYQRLAGFDTGSWLLARAGLLDGYRATIHWEELTRFAETFPQVDVQRERFVLDRDRVTCSGAMAAFDLITHLITEDHGQMLGLEVAQLFMVRDSVRSHRSGSGRTTFVDRALDIMQEHLEDPVPIADLARRIGCSQKTLEERMKTHMGATPRAVYRRLRLNLARKLVVDTDQSVAEIAGRCGYDNASALTRAFRDAFGSSPRALRSATTEVAKA